MNDFAKSMTNNSIATLSATLQSVHMQLYAMADAVLAQYHRITAGHAAERA